MSEVIKEGRHGGATIASLIARAEDCRSKATSAIEASVLAVQVENPEAAANLLLTASKLFMESADNYTQASMVDRANGVELRQEAAEMTAIAQEVDRESKSIYATTTARNTEIVEVIPNTFEETWKSADDVEVWNVPFYKGDYLGHPFRGNQHSGGMSGGAKELSDKALAMTVIQSKDHEVRAALNQAFDGHKQLALDHAIHVALHGNAGDAKEAQLHREASQAHMDAQVAAAKALTSVYTQSGTTVPPELFAEYAAKAKDASIASSQPFTATHPVDKSAEIAKGDFSGHPFRGNQYAQGAGSSVATIRELTDKMSQGGNLNYHEGDHQAIADAHDYMSGWHFAKEEEARDRGDREAVLAHRNAGSEHAYAAGVASQAEQNAEAWDRTSGSSDRSFDAEARMDEAPSTSEADALVLPASLDALGATQYALLTDQSTYSVVP